MLSRLRRPLPRGSAPCRGSAPRRGSVPGMRFACRTRRRLLGSMMRGGVQPSQRDDALFHLRRFALAGCGSASCCGRFLCSRRLLALRRLFHLACLRFNRPAAVCLGICMLTHASSLLRGGSAAFFRFSRFRFRLLDRHDPVEKIIIGIALCCAFCRSYRCSANFFC